VLVGGSTDRPPTGARRPGGSAESQPVSIFRHTDITRTRQACFRGSTTKQNPSPAIGIRALVLRILLKIKSTLESITMTSSVRATCWSVTLNMKTVKKETCDEMIQQARAAGWVITGQEEMGGENPHYQLMVQTPQVRFSAVKKMFPTGHIEVARNRQALAKYVTKEDTRVGALPEHDEKYVTASRLWDMIYQYNENQAVWDRTEFDSVRCYKDGDQQSLERDPLAFFDKMISLFIRQGYYVDMLACNPAIRSFWKKFWPAILERSCKADRQTDRQDVKFSHEETINLPTYNAENDSEGQADGSGTRDGGSTDGSSDEEGESGSSTGRDEGSGAETDADDDWEGS